jgi:hypothetical protein
MANPLDKDTCIYIEANAGDQGVHNTQGVWWLSPDVSIVPLNPEGEVTPGFIHKFQIRVHKKATPCSFGGKPTNVILEAHIAIPSLVIDPGNPEQSQFVGEGQFLAQFVNVAGLEFAAIQFNPSGAPEDAGKPNGPGHRCLVARCYPDNLKPSPVDFFLPGDPHVAQRNIVIASSIVAMSARVEFDFATANVSRSRRARVTLTAAPDLNPRPNLLGVIREAIRGVDGFKQFSLLTPTNIRNLQNQKDPRVVEKRLAAAMPRSFGLHLPSVGDAEVRDASRPVRYFDSLGRLTPRRFTASFSMAPKQLGRFTFRADLSRSAPGTAHIFHLRHAEDGEVKGGLTFVAMIKER